VAHSKINPCGARQMYPYIEDIEDILISSILVARLHCIIISVKAFHVFRKAFPHAFLATQIDSGESSRQLTAQSSMGGEFAFLLR